ncbi:MAG: FadR family transcriptional regulator [Spirochaetaceae bacterium]|nr:MAG: FadR family transcriptional regulator [Spirochaetaceae bacterium]
MKRIVQIIRVALNPMNPLTNGLISINIITMTKLQRITTAEAVVNYINNQIQEGHLKPGDSLPSERNLVKDLGISRFSLREGLARLSALGIVYTQQGKGAFVTTELNPESLRQVFLPAFSGSKKKIYDDLFVARRILEEEISAQAVAKRSEEDLQELQQILEETGRSIDEPPRYASLDSQFHKVMANISDNLFLQKMLELVHNYIQAFVVEHAKDSSCRQVGYQDHLRLFECIKNRDAEGIHHAMSTHLAHFKDYYERRLGNLDS